MTNEELKEKGLLEQGYMVETENGVGIIEKVSSQEDGEDEVVNYLEQGKGFDLIRGTSRLTPKILAIWGYSSHPKLRGPEHRELLWKKVSYPLGTILEHLDDESLYIVTSMEDDTFWVQPVHLFATKTLSGIKKYSKEALGANFYKKDVTPMNIERHRRTLLTREGVVVVEAWQSLFAYRRLEDMKTTRLDKCEIDTAVVLWENPKRLLGGKIVELTTELPTW